MTKWPTRKFWDHLIVASTPVAQMTRFVIESCQVRYLVLIFNHSRVISWYQEAHRVSGSFMVFCRSHMFKVFLCTSFFYSFDIFWKWRFNSKVFVDFISLWRHQKVSPPKKNSFLHELLSTLIFVLLQKVQLLTFKMHIILTSCKYGKSQQAHPCLLAISEKLSKF